MRGMRRGLLPLALGSVWIAPGALAQDRSVLPPGAIVQPTDDGAGSELRRNLTLLAQNPRSVSALNGAGAAALDMGDADAALNFFTRAADADPSSARARAGMAQALVRLERASEALPLFAEAVRMGAPEAEIAGDRGLAWDTLGYPARAQADYALSLRGEDDPEIRRRLALSLAITGQRAEALRVIEPQLRANDRAAWRTQAFILALTGDPAGAGQTARNMMPGAAEALSPFLQRLASLSPSQKALAVHFGHFPSDGRAQRFAEADSVADPGALAMARGSVPMGQARIRNRPSSPTALEADATRRRPDMDETRLAAAVRPAPTRPGDAAPRRQYSAPSFAEPISTGEGGPPAQYAAAQPGGSPAPAWPTPVLDERQSHYPSRPPSPPPPPPPSNPYPRQDNSQSPGFSLVPQGRPLGKPPETAPQRPERPTTDFSIVTSAVDELEDEASSEVAPPVEDIAPPVRTRTRPAQTTRSADSRNSPSQAAGSNRNNRTRQTPAQANPSRVWVQVATGTNRAGLTFTYGQFRRRAPALLNGRAAYVAPNRLLVGPFPTEAAANSFARQLAARGVQGHSWTSDAGQRIDQLQAAASNDPPATTRSRTASSERSGAGGRNARGGTGSRTERNASRTERSAGNNSGRNRNGATNNRTGNSRTASANSRSGGPSGRNGTTSNRNGTANGRTGRNGSANTRTANANNGRDRAGSGRNNGTNAGRAGTRGAKPAATASARTTRGGSSGQPRSSTRRGR